MEPSGDEVGGRVEPPSDLGVGGVGKFHVQIGELAREARHAAAAHDRSDFARTQLR